MRNMVPGQTKSKSGQRAITSGSASETRAVFSCRNESLEIRLAVFQQEHKFNDKTQVTVKDVFDDGNNLTKYKIYADSDKIRNLPCPCTGGVAGPNHHVIQECSLYEKDEKDGDTLEIPVVGYVPLGDTKQPWNLFWLSFFATLHNLCDIIIVVGASILFVLARRNDIDTSPRGVSGAWTGSGCYRRAYTNADGVTFDLHAEKHEITASDLAGDSRLVEFVMLPTVIFVCVMRRLIGTQLYSEHMSI